MYQLNLDPMQPRWRDMLGGRLRGQQGQQDLPDFPAGALAQAPPQQPGAPAGWQNPALTSFGPQGYAPGEPLGQPNSPLLQQLQQGAPVGPMSASTPGMASSTQRPGTVPLMTQGGETFFVPQERPQRDWRNTPMAPGMPTLDDIAGLYGSPLDTYQRANPFTGERYVSDDSRRQALQAWLGALQGVGGARIQAADLGLRQIEALGLPGMGGRMANDAQRTQNETERHRYALSPEGRIDEAMRQWRTANPDASEEEGQRMRNALLRELGGSSQLRPGQPAGAPGQAGGQPGSALSAALGAAGSTGSTMPPMTPAAGGPGTPGGPAPWAGIADRLDRALYLNGRDQQSGRPTRSKRGIADFLAQLDDPTMQQNAPALHAYLLHHFGAQAAVPGGAPQPSIHDWFTARMSRVGAPTPDDEQRRRLIAAFNASGANIGVSSRNAQTRGLSYFDPLGRAIQGIGGLLGFSDR